MTQGDARGLSAAHRPGIGTIVAAVLLPPLGIFLARGLAPRFWIGFALTMLFLVPGIVFALVAVLRPDVLPGR